MADARQVANLKVLEDVEIDGDLDVAGFLGVGTIAFETIAAGVLAVTNSVVGIVPESGTTDDLDTINGPPGYSLLFLRASGATTITLKHGTGNIYVGDAADMTINSAQFCMMLCTGGGCYVIKIT